MTGKRLLDCTVAAAALLLLSPLIVLLMLAVACDGGSPLYRARRVGLHNRDFTMLKLRTMTAGAEALGGTSTSRSDPRLTHLGPLLRRSKLDELPQLWNVLLGHMSLVGPRPNTRRGGVDRYTAEELRLLTIAPGITDLASIVFADESEILDGRGDADETYDRLIRPWKSRLGLLYLDRHAFGSDLLILCLTALALFDRRLALRGVGVLLGRWGADPQLRFICRRTPGSCLAPSEVLAAE